MVNDQKPGFKRKRSVTETLSRQEIIDNIMVKRSSYLEVSGLRIDLSEEEVTIGSDPACSIYLPMEGVSGTHCRIYYHDEQYYLEDLQSTNGSYLNNLKIERGVLRGGDQITLGTVKIVYREKQEQ